MQQKHTFFLSGLLVLALGGFFTLLSMDYFSNAEKVAKPQASVIIDIDQPDEECSPGECGDSTEDPTYANPEADKDPDECTADTWKCETWDTCSADGKQSRTCTLTDDCEAVKTPKPETTQTCTPPEPECTADTWSCNAWGACSAEGEKFRNCTMTFNCPTVQTPQPYESQKCTPPPPPVVETEVIEEAESTEEDIRSAAEEKFTPEQETFIAEQVPVIEKEAVEQIEVKKQEQVRLEEVVEKTPAFKKLIDASPPPVRTYDLDINGNGVPDGLDKLAGIDASKPDPKIVRQEAELAAKRKQLIDEGTSVAEADKIIHKQKVKVRQKNKIDAIHAVAEKIYKTPIKDNKQDSNNDGISDETEISLGLNPTARVNSNSNFSAAERRLYGFNDDAVNMGTPQLQPQAGAGMGTPQLMPNAQTSVLSAGMGTPQLLPKSESMAMGVSPGEKLPSDGFAVLAAGAPNSAVTLVAVDRTGKETELARGTVSPNGKAVLSVEREMPKGDYVMQVRSAVAGYGRNSTLTDVEPERSPAVLVSVIDETDIDQPTVKNIQDLEVLGLKDIRVTRGEDGKIHVRGSSDISSTVIGTFQSAVFTAAILTNVTSGSFEVASPQELEDGVHDVTIYATRPEEGLRSKPVKVHFQIIESAQAANDEESSDGNVSGTGAGAPNKSGFPLIPVAAGGVIVVAVGVGIALKKRRP